MSDPNPNPVPLRRMVYVLLITVAAAAVAARILSAAGTFADNDRSRWDTVRALVENGTYVIGDRDFDPTTGRPRDHGISAEENWKTIDKVLPRDANDFDSSKPLLFYSSKPPLLPTLVAGEYWLLKRVLGWSIAEKPWLVVRTVLLTINWIPFVVYLLLLARLVEWRGRTDWGRLYVLAAGCFATFLNPFQNSFNNHTVATCSALFALYPALRIWYGQQQKAWLFVVAGFFAGFTACTELPAASFAVLLFAILLWHDPRRTLLLFAPALALPVSAFLLTNYLALGQLRPAYSELGGPWYQYEGSHWNPPSPDQETVGIDYAYLKESKASYAFHVLVGHHGWFSLTPIFLLSLAGIIACLVVRPRPTSSTAANDVSSEPPDLRVLAGLTLVVSIVVMGFYIIKTGNYGGWTVGLRWLMWLTPFWLLMMLPVADYLSHSRVGRGIGYLCLALSVFAVSFSVNPWRHPWLYYFLEDRGWIHY